MKALKRASIGGYVQADVTGTGEWLVGRITGFDNKTVYFQPADGSEVVKMLRDEVYRATKAEYEDVVVKHLESVAQIQEEDVVVPEILAEEDEDQPKGAKNGIIKPESVAKYVVGVTGNGRKSKHNGDVVAVMFEGKTLEEVIILVAAETGASIEELSTRWAHLNNGMQRMNVGNFLRRHIKKATSQ